MHTWFRAVNRMHLSITRSNQENHPIVEAQVAGIPVTYAAFCHAVAISEAPLSRAEGYSFAHLLGSRAGMVPSTTSSNEGNVDVKLLQKINAHEFLHASYL